MYNKINFFYCFRYVHKNVFYTIAIEFITCDNTIKMYDLYYLQINIMQVD